MKQLMCLLAAAVLVSGSAFSQELKTTKRSGAAIPPAPQIEATKGAPAAKKPAGKTIKGNVVSVMTYCSTGKAPALTGAQAADMAKRGELLGVLSGSKLYVVVNADGSSAANKLAKGGAVVLSGKVMSKGGVNLVAANTVE